MRAMRLSEYLANQKISDSEFARRVGVSHSLVHRWKSGEKRPSMETASRIRDATGGAVTADDFMDPPSTAIMGEGASAA